MEQVALEIEIIPFRKIQYDVAAKQTPCADERFTSFFLALYYYKPLLKLNDLI